MHADYTGATMLNGGSESEGWGGSELAWTRHQRESGTSGDDDGGGGGGGGDDELHIRGKLGT